MFSTPTARVRAGASPSIYTSGSLCAPFHSASVDGIDAIEKKTEYKLVQGPILRPILGLFIVGLKETTAWQHQVSSTMWPSGGSTHSMT